MKGREDRRQFKKRFQCEKKIGFLLPIRFLNLHHEEEAGEARIETCWSVMDLKFMINATLKQQASCACKDWNVMKDKEIIGLLL